MGEYTMADAVRDSRARQVEDGEAAERLEREHRRELLQELIDEAKSNLDDSYSAIDDSERLFRFYLVQLNAKLEREQ